jgi:hypothetical protein
MSTNHKTKADLCGKNEEMNCVIWWHEAETIYNALSSATFVFSER